MKVSCNLLSLDKNNLSYLLGYLFSDGYMDKHHRAYVMSTELDIIVKFKNILEHTGKICSYEKSGFGVTAITHQLNFCGKYAEFLEQCGFKNDKSILTVPDNIELSHFVRGLFDGDGSISTRVRTEGIGIGNVKFTGYHDLIFSLQQKIGGSVYQDIRKKNTYSLQFSGKRAMDLLDWMYRDAEIYLDRKYSKYRSINVSKHKYIRERIAEFVTG